MEMALLLSYYSFSYIYAPRHLSANATATTSWAACPKCISTSRARRSTRSAWTCTTARRSSSSTPSQGRSAIGAKNMLPAHRPRPRRRHAPRGQIQRRRLGDALLRIHAGPRHGPADRVLARYTTRPSRSLGRPSVRRSAGDSRRRTAAPAGTSPSRGTRRSATGRPRWASTCAASTSPGTRWSGEAKRDYPAGIFSSRRGGSPIRRSRTTSPASTSLMTRGAEVRDLLVVHPVESMWAIYNSATERRTSSRTLSGSSATTPGSQPGFRLR